MQREYYNWIRGGKLISAKSLLRDRASPFNREPRLAVVIGTFAAVPYIHLHLEARRRFYPDVPALVHDDASPCAEKLQGLCRDYGAQFECHQTRSPACKGDLAAFLGGLLWAREIGSSLLLKLSRRFIPTCDWTNSLCQLAKESQYSTYSSWTTSFNFGFRTECMGMAVSDWADHDILEELAHLILLSGEPFVEGAVHAIARRLARRNSQDAIEYDKRVGPRHRDRDGYAFWDFMGTDRKARSANFLWHDSTTPEEYYEVGCNWGLPYSFELYADPNAGYGSRPGR